MMTYAQIRLTAVVCTLGFASSLDAQPRTAFPAQRGVALTEFPRLIKLANNVYGYEEIRAPGFTTVSLVVIGSNGILIADGQGSVQATQTMVTKIHELSPLPIRWYVVGSDHGDHTAGNSVLPSNITYIVSPASKLQLEKDAKGATPPRVVAVPPVAMSNDTEVIDVGGTTVRVLNLGRAHTGGDIMVQLPKEKILFMSEVFLNRVFPAMRSAYPTEWVHTIDNALALPIDRYVPGHGFIEAPKASREELIVFRGALVAVIKEVTRLHTLGISVEDAVKQADWGAYKEWFLADQQAAVAVHKVYEELDGKLKKGM